MMLEALRGGNYIETAAEYAGIDDSTYRRWMQREEPEFRAFRAAVKKALADAEVRNVGIVLKAAPTQWQAAAWWLERRHPSVYGRRTQVAADVNVNLTASADWLTLRDRLLSALTPFPEALDAVLAELGGGESVDGVAVELPEITV